jgi:ribonuclease HI
MSLYRALIVDGGCSFSAWAAARSLNPFVRRLFNLREVYQPATVWVAWDCPRELGWRRGASAAYKAKRQPQPEGYTEALADLRAILPALDVVQVSAPGCEADDLLFSLSRTLPGPVLLASADKDLLQAVHVDVDLLRLASRKNFEDTLVTVADCWTYWTLLGGQRVGGLTPDGWRDLLTLGGDSTDGVTGLKGVGPQGALALLAACPDLLRMVLDGERGGDEQARRECYARDARVAKYVEQAIEQREALRLSRELVGLRLVEAETVDAYPDESAARTWLEERGMGRLAREVAA